MMEILSAASLPILIHYLILIQTRWKSSLESPSFPVHTTCTSLDRNWWKSSLELPSTPRHIPYATLKQMDGNPLWGFLPSTSIFPTQFLYKFDANPRILSGASCPPNTYSLHNSYPKLMKILLVLPSTQIHIAYSLLIPNYRKSSLAPPSLPTHAPYSVLIQLW